MIPYAAAFLAARSAQRVDPPVITTAPAIVGSAVVGATLVASTGTWTGSPTSHAWQWMRGGADVLGATGSSYTLTAADIGYAISVRVTAVNAGGSATATSGVTAQVQSGVPTNTALPTVSGATTVGSTLSSTAGTWTNGPTGYTRQWLRGGSVISGATGSSYTLTAADIGYAISVRVTASNANGSATATSAATDTVAYPAPVNVDLPAISGSAAVGNTLTVSNGTWTNSPTSYARQWRRGSTNISGATGTQYTVTEADIGYTISCRVTATNAGGSTVATATAGTVGDPVPSSVTAPVISGTVAVGSTLTASTGTWTGSPTSYSRQWQRGTSNIIGATGSSYTLTSADIGHTIRCRVTATNGAGSATATSASTSTVPQPANPPANTSAPSISGTGSIGNTLTANGGSWSGSPTSHRYEWFRLGGAGGNKVVGTASSYTLTSSDAGGTIYLSVWASNASGESDVANASNSISVAGAPVNTGLPTISGAAKIGNTVTASTGAWSGSPTSYSYQWQTRIDTDNDPSGYAWSNIVGQTGNSHVITGIPGIYRRVRVTATNAYGSTQAFSNPFGPSYT